MKPIEDARPLTAETLDELERYARNAVTFKAIHVILSPDVVLRLLDAALSPSAEPPETETTL